MSKDAYIPDLSNYIPFEIDEETGLMHPKTDKMRSRVRGNKAIAGASQYLLISVPTNHKLIITDIVLRNIHSGTTMRPVTFYSTSGVTSVVIPMMVRDNGYEFIAQAGIPCSSSLRVKPLSAVTMDIAVAGLLLPSNVR